ncbi:selection and upkeep of intraepithelial T-cells protein 1-like isoform X2 [Myotis myotis]|uniref:selection and upkeep of intraepithelial T-cells protein 1-like isoform X2 n=1 Tax=Myotis myotis TaxID=51298 RepID=UPI00174DB899|nr:selection and upkeep of intraepithelial T-cells protein 1-like isoform X2 [Myotis myotis]
MEFMYFVAILLMQMPVPISAQFIVHGTVEPLVAPLGGHVEIHCHLSPPQSAAHMEVRWFRNRYTQPVYLYQDGRDFYGEIIKDYVERTKLLKESIGEGNVTLRIENVVASDSGEYHCLFKDSDFSEEAIVEIKIAAVGLEMQFNVNVTSSDIIVECNSGGWFPKPQIQWIDSSGQIIPPSSESYSQDQSKLFHISTTLILNDNSKRGVTCNLQNPITGQKKRTNIKLEDDLLPDNIYWKVPVAPCIIIAVMLFVRYVYFLCYQPRNKGFLLKVFISMLLVYGGLATFLLVIQYPATKEPVNTDNIITNKEKFVIHSVIIVFVSMISSLLYTFQKVCIDEDFRHGKARACALRHNKLYRWLALPSHREIRVIFFLDFQGTWSSNQDHEDEATHELATIRSQDCNTTKRRRATL